MKKNRGDLESGLENMVELLEGEVRGLQALTMEERGQLFTAIMEYKPTVTYVNFSSAAVAVAWGFLEPRVRRQSERRDRQKEVAKNAASARWHTFKKQGAKKYD
jgi:hypothetical protein